MDSYLTSTLLSPPHKQTAPRSYVGKKRLSITHTTQLEFVIFFMYSHFRCLGTNTCTSLLPNYTFLYIYCQQGIKQVIILFDF